MSLPQTPSLTSSHPYSHALQIRLYQAFIFSIPILFSIILFLLFYLFYLKRRAYALSNAPPPLPTSFNNYGNSFVPMPYMMGFKGDLKDKLPKVVFDELLKAKDSVCCVCLGEFEMREELIQVPSCKHVFHKDCIHHWLQSNSTCPLCRCCVFLAVGPISSPTTQQAHFSGEGPILVQSTQGTSSQAQSTTPATNDCLRISSSQYTNHNVSSGLSIVIQDQAQ